MLRSLKDLENYKISATDGDIGHVRDFYFDDHAWVIRYLIVETGTWLSSRQVLISPISIQHPNWAKKLLPVLITQEQVKNSPDIDTKKPVSRQHETQYLNYYGYPDYWVGDGLWGSGAFPYSLSPVYAGTVAEPADRMAVNNEIAGMEAAQRRNDDPNLRSCAEVVGYRIHATDGEIGHVAGLLVDEETWAIRYLIVDTSNWWFGHQVLISPQWITAVSWPEQSVTIDLTRDSVKTAPNFDSTQALNREHEPEFTGYYKRPAYRADRLVLEREI
jgi:uncharacterized protein YrrD